MPFADLQGRGVADVLRLVPGEKVRRFVESAIRSATAYSSRRSALVCAVFGQLTTMAMYFGRVDSLRSPETAPAEGRKPAPPVESESDQAS
jgi:hypothetical protein